MRRGILLLVAVLAVALMHGLTIETASFTEFLYGRTEDTAYDNWMSHIVEGLASPGYNQYAPWDRQTNGFGTYVRANTDQLEQWGEIVAFFLAGQYDDATNAIEVYEFPYEVVQFNDTDTDRTYYMLRELLNDEYFDDNGKPDKPEIHQHGSFDYGWGLYVFNPDSEVPVIVNTPHPKDDFISVPISHIAFQQWDARYFMINGAGREAMWSNVPPFNNGKSRSDPTRNNAHPFNTAYRAFCDEIRATFGRQEFSVQIHSFDYTHMGYKSLQLALGSVADNYPNLPIRDLSGNNRDIINASPYVIHPANSIGMHNEVLVTDYYAVHYNTHGLNYYHEELGPLRISNRINLTGISGPQFAYTFGSSVWSRHDHFSPFFHIEMEELPSIYPQTMPYYRWFYGYDERTQRWDADNFFTRANAYYTPWIDALGSILGEVLAFDDGTPPTNPANMRITSNTGTRVSLAWDRSYDYDFHTYEVVYAQEPLDFAEPNYTVINRSNLSRLAAQAYTTISFTSINAERNYYFAVRALDANGNYSEFSNAAERLIGSARVSDFKAIGRDGAIAVSWTANWQSANRGFKIWRALGDTDEFEVLSSYEDNEFLEGNELNNFPYGYLDEDIENDVIYTYRLTCVDEEDNEHSFYYSYAASAHPIYKLYFSNEEGTIVDSLEFGVNRFTDDSFNGDFDILKGSQPTGNYIYAMTHYNLGITTRILQRDIYGYFDTALEMKSWPLRLRTNQYNTPITVSISDNYFRNSEKLYLRYQPTGEFTNLAEEPFVFETGTNNWRLFTLYWGNMQPLVDIENTLWNSVVKAEEVIRFQWTVSEFPFLIDSYELYLANSSDSIFVALIDEMPLADSLLWEVPAETELLNARLHLKVNLYDGYSFVKTSGYVLSIYDNNLIYDFAAGARLISYPLNGEGRDTETVFGENTTVYFYDNETGEYVETDSLRFGRGYFINASEEIHFETRGVVLDSSYILPLRSGWNLVPNALFNDIAVNQLRFVHNGDTFNYGETITFRLIENRIYTIADAKHRRTSHIGKASSYLIYCNVDFLDVLYNPFYQGASQLEYPTVWEIAVAAVSETGTGDDIIIGALPGSNHGYDAYYDLPKPPQIPGAGFRLYLSSDIDSHPFPMMHSEYQSPLTEENEMRHWDFVIERNNADEEEFIFMMNADNLPEFHVLDMIIGEEFFRINPDEELVCYLQGTRIEGRFVVTKTPPTNIENETAPDISVVFANYPNPFVPGLSGTRRGGGTNIMFYLGEAARVQLEVFNIKGQRVRTLLNEDLDRGKYSVHWDGKNVSENAVAAGIYFYRLKAGDKVVGHKKMLMLH